MMLQIDRDIFEDMQSIVKPYIKKSWFRALFSLAITWSYMFFIAIPFSGFTWQLAFNNNINIAYRIGLLVLSWFVLGWGGFTSIFVIGHDMAHGAFWNSPLNTFIGSIHTSICMHPFHGWRIAHDQHHNHAGDTEIFDKDKPLYRDNAWTDVLFAKDAPSLFKRILIRVFLFSGFTGLAHVYRLFQSKLFVKPDKSLALKSIAFTAVFISTLLLTVGILTGAISLYNFDVLLFLRGAMHFYVVPNLFFLYQYAAYTYMHHFSDRAKLYSSLEQGENKWSIKKSVLDHTVNSRMPSLISVLHHRIDIHIPHHLNRKIPCYNLYQANKALQQKYGKLMIEFSFSMKKLWNALWQNFYWNPEKGKYYSLTEELQNVHNHNESELLESVHSPLDVRLVTTEISDL